MSAPKSASTVATGTPAAALPVDLNQLERLAQPAMSPMAWDYVRGGAADEITLRENRAAYDRIRLKPRVLCDVSRIDTAAVLLSQPLACPILLAPAAYHRLYHPDGEIATVTGAARMGAGAVISSFATVAIEDIVRSAASARPWFQLYVNPDRRFTQQLVERVENAGCAAICLTVDTPVLGCRYRERDFKLPAGIECPNVAEIAGEAVAAHRPVRERIYSAVFDSSLSWRDIAWLRSVTRLPIVLKGILNPDDAARALDAGVDAIIVSNHGGRNLDTVPATIEVLPLVAERVSGKIPVLVDGGIRRGTDILKALALGARAVLIGRPYLYGLALAGADGVAHVIDVLRAEFEMAMALAGRTTLQAIDRTVLWE
ncbi:MAG TPA: alpha-hydroxy acid oxidase [Terriglobales bacterium]|nr:alpha-hydroxy acid oxidase [Terriglobales bacterium]